MQKFIKTFDDGQGNCEYLHLEGENAPDQWDVCTWEKNGVLERSVRPAIAWTEVGTVSKIPGKVTYPQQDLLRDQQRAARRAKTTCRRVIISEGFDEMLTLTYRENQEDRALCKQHFNIWFKRMKRALGSFRFCASFERQERGSMHVHIATHKLPQHADYKGVKIQAWQLGTRIWRDIVGQDNGLCFVGAKTRNGGSSRRRKLSLAKMASYVSKYILKDFEQSPAETNRYSRSNGVEVGKCHRMNLHCTFREIIELTFDQGEGDVVISHRVNPLFKSIWLCTEVVPPDPPVRSR